MLTNNITLSIIYAHNIHNNNLHNHSIDRCMLHRPNSIEILSGIEKNTFYKERGKQIVAINCKIKNS